MKRPASGSQGQSEPERNLDEEIPAISASQEPKRGLRQAFTSLRQRNYRLYWFGQLISLIGSSMQIVGQAWLVLQLTHSPFQLGVVGALQFLPVLLFALFGGVFADRWPKRRILLCTQTAELIQALLLWLLVFTGTVQIWHIYVLAVLLGLTNSLDQPTRSSFVVEMVGRAELPNAVALNSLLLNSARIIGPGLGGIIIAASGVTLLFLLNAGSFLAVIVALALMNAAELHIPARELVHGGERQKTWQSLREGMAYIWKSPAIVLVILVVGLVLLFGANYNVVLPLFATEVLHAGATGYGFLSAAISVGSLFAALWLAWSNQRPTIRLVLVGTLIFSVLEAVFALSNIYLLSLVLIAAIGVAENIFGTLATTMLQIISPDHLRGRVISVYILFFTGSIPLGYLLAGWLSSLFGVAIGLLICAFLCLLVVGAGWLKRKAAEKDFAASVRL